MFLISDFHNKVLETSVKFCQITKNLLKPAIIYCIIYNSKYSKYFCFLADILNTF